MAYLVPLFVELQHWWQEGESREAPLSCFKAEVMIVVALKTRVRVHSFCLNYQTDQRTLHTVDELVWMWSESRKNDINQHLDICYRIWWKLINGSLIKIHFDHQIRKQQASVYNL